MIVLVCPAQISGGAEMLEKLKTESKVVGIKQLRRALKEHKASLVFLAKDADPALTEPLLAQCRESGVEVVCDVTMPELGRACGIAVGAAAAAIVRRNEETAG